MIDHILYIIFKAYTIVFMVLAMLWFMPSYLSAQLITTTDILDQVIRLESSNLPFSQSIDFYKEKKQGLPLVSNVSIRTETDEFNWREQHYQLRFEFNGLNQRRIQDDLIDAQKSEYIARQGYFLLNTIKDCYVDIIKWYFIDQDSKLLENEFILLEDKKMIIQKLIKNGDKFSINKWLSIEKSIRRSISDRSINQFEVREINHRLISKDSSILFVNDWISIDEIDSFVELTEMSKTHPIDLMNKTVENIALEEYQLEKAESRKWFDFVQLEYKENEKLPIAKEFSLGASFNIPNKAFDRVKLNEAQLKILETKDRATLEGRKRNDILSRTISKIRIGIKNYKEQIDFINSGKIMDTYEAYRKIPGVSPLVLLDLKLALLSNQKELVKIQKGIFQYYIELLYLTGKMSEAPLKNYLHKDMITF